MVDFYFLCFVFHPVVWENFGGVLKFSDDDEIFRRDANLLVYGFLQTKNNKLDLLNMYRTSEFKLRSKKYICNCIPKYIDFDIFNGKSVVSLKKDQLQ